LNKNTTHNVADKYRKPTTGGSLATHCQFPDRTGKGIPMMGFLSFTGFATMPSKLGLGL